MAESKITIYFLKMSFQKSLFAIIALAYTQKPLSHLHAPLERFVKIFTNNKALVNQGVH